MHNLLPPKLLTNLPITALNKEQIIRLKNLDINGFVIELNEQESLDAAGKLIGQIRAASSSAAIIVRLPDNKLKVVSSSQKEFFLDEIVQLRTGKEQILNDIIISSSNSLSSLTLGAYLKIGANLKLRITEISKDGDSIKAKVVRSGSISVDDKIISKDINFSLSTSAGKIKQYLQFATDFDVDFVAFTPNSESELKVLTSSFHRFGQIINVDLFNYDYVTQYVKNNTEVILSLNIDELILRSDLAQALEFLSKLCKFSNRHKVNCIIENDINNRLTEDKLLAMVGLSRFPVDALMINYRANDIFAEELMSQQFMILKKIRKSIHTKIWSHNHLEMLQADLSLKTLGLSEVNKTVVISSSLEVVKELNALDSAKELLFVTNDPNLQKKAALLRNVTAFYLKDFPKSYDTLLEKSILHLFSAGVINISETLMVISGSTYSKSSKDGRAEIIEAKTYLLA